MRSQSSRIILVLSLIFYVSLTRADSSDDESFANSEGGAPMEHRDDIINSLPKIPKEKPKEPSGKLQIGIKKRAEHCDRQAQKGDSVHIHYKGYLRDGTEFDSSYKRGHPLQFTLGSGQVIKGWDSGLLGICAGEMRKLIIPSHLAYGDHGSPPTIPPDATLVFEVEAIKVERILKQDL